MKFALILILVVCVFGCGRKFSAPDLELSAKNAEVIILADVRNDRDKIRIYAREVLKGRLEPGFRFGLGDEITPTFGGAPGWGENQPDQMLLFYRVQFGTLAFSSGLSVVKGRVLSVTGSENSLDAFISKLRAPNHTAEPVSPSRAGSP